VWYGPAVKLRVVQHRMKTTSNSHPIVFSMSYSECRGHGQVWLAAARSRVPYVMSRGDVIVPPTNVVNSTLERGKQYTCKQLCYKIAQKYYCILYFNKVMKLKNRYFIFICLSIFVFYFVRLTFLFLLIMLCLLHFSFRRTASSIHSSFPLYFRRFLIGTGSSCDSSCFYISFLYIICIPIFL
jgi:hypothetical protein